MRYRVLTDQVIAETMGARIQAIRLKKNLSLDFIAKNAGISRQTLYSLLNCGKGTLINIIAVLRVMNELERLSSMLEDILPSPLQVIRMEGKKRQRASGRRERASDSRTKIVGPQKSNDW